MTTALKWDLDYLQSNLGPGPFTVFVNTNTDLPLSPEPELRSPSSSEETQKKKPKNSQREATRKSSSSSSRCSDSNSRSLMSNSSRPRKRHNYFKYYDEKKVEVFNGDFVPEIKREEVSFDEFLVKFHGNRHGRLRTIHFTTRLLYWCQNLIFHLFLF